MIAELFKPLERYNTLALEFVHMHCDIILYIRIMIVGEAFNGVFV